MTCLGQLKASTRTQTIRNNQDALTGSNQNLTEKLKMPASIRNKILTASLLESSLDHRLKLDYDWPPEVSKLIWQLGICFLSCGSQDTKENILKHWFSTLLMLRSFCSVPHIVMT